MIEKRTHDKFYLKEDYKSTPKEYFKFVFSEMKKDNLDIENKTILDIGCATGDFLYYVKNQTGNEKLTGMDIMPELLEKVDEGINTIEGNIADKSTIPKKTFDIVSMLGVMGIFDNLEKIIDNVMTLVNTERGGCFYLFGGFNPEDLDVIIKSKNSKKDDDHWETGWNTFSLYSIEKYCKQKGYSYAALPFYLEIDIPKHEDDPLRSWTVPMADGRRMVINGLQLVHNFYLIKIGK